MANRSINIMLFGILAVSLLVSCIEYQTVQADRTINIPNKKECLELLDVFSDFKVVELENNEKCMLSKVKKLQYTDSMVYIWNQNANPSLLAFHKDGRFYKEIGKRGNGRGEYKNIVDFAVDNKDNKVYILSELSTILVYNTEGDYIFSKRLSNSSFFRNILKMDNGFVFSTNHLRLEENKDECLLYFYDNELKLIEKKLEVLPVPMFQPPFVRFPLQMDNKYLCYFDCFNTCFHFLSLAEKLKDESVALYNDRLFNYEDVVSERVYKNGADFDEITKEYYADGKVYGWGNFFGIYNMFIFNKKKNEFKTYRYTDWNPEIMDYYQKRFYSVVSPDVFLNPEIFKSKRTQHLLSKLKNTLSNEYDFDSNFCIISFKLR